MSRQNQALDLDGVIRVDKLPADGRRIAIKADDEQLAQLAERFVVSEVKDFGAEVTAKRFKGGIRAEGRVWGHIVQPCGVTGEPVEQAIDEDVDRVFLRGHDAASEAPAGAEVYVNLESDDLPDYFEGEEIDIGALVLEVFALAIDLYPRAPGASLPEKGVGDDASELSPFAALKALKTDGNK